MTDKQTKLGEERNTDFDYLKDVRTFDQYQRDVIHWTKIESDSAKKFIETCKQNGISAIIAGDTSCESTSPACFHYDVKKVHTAPDYMIGLFGLYRYLEVKHTPKNVSRIMIKKYDVDKYLQRRNVLLLHVINQGNGSEQFTVLIPEEIVKWPCEVNEKFGGKELYVKPIKDYPYYKFGLIHNDLKAYLQGKITRRCLV